VRRNPEPAGSALGGARPGGAGGADLTGRGRPGGRTSPFGSPKHKRLLAWGVSAAVGGFAVGYHLGVISGALLFVRQDFGLSNLQQGALVSILPLGAMLGSLYAGRLADAVGRRRTLMIVAVVFVAGIALTVIASSFTVLLAGRAIEGLALGAASSTGPLYLSEISPPALRGGLVTLNQLMITLGIVVSYCVDLIFSGSGSWRAMFAVGLVPAVALFILMLRSPETPAWLDGHGHPERAKEVALEVTDEATAERLLEDFRRMREQQRKRIRGRDLARSAARPALLTSVTLAALMQFGGINVIIYYAPRIMEKTGLSASNSILASVIVGIVNVVATVVSVRLVDRTGRRPLLRVSIAGMFVSLVLLGLALVLSLGSASGWLALACLVAYIAAFAVGLGPMFWLLIAEIFPPEARTAGASVAAATNWFSNFLVGLVFLPIAAAIGQGPTFWIFAAVCAIAFVFVNRYVPETKGRSFTEIDNEVRARWGSPPGQEATAH
jgi:MFS transporter, SP family, galactose:H+ symporter